MLWQVRQLLYTPTCIASTFAVIGIVFIGVGIGCAAIESTVQSLRQVYYDGSAANSCPDTATKPCLVEFELAADIAGPVYFYYTLDNFYQNHRRYVSSKNDAIDNGRFGEEGPGADPSASVFAKCTFSDIAYWVAADGTTTSYNRGVATDKAVYNYPCGLVARSTFNDTFSLHKGKWTEGTKELVSWTSKGIAWRDGSDAKYQSKPDNWLRANCYSLGEFRLGDDTFNTSGFHGGFSGFKGTRDVTKSRYHCWKNISDESYNVWMNTAATSRFSKLHRIIPGGLTAGVYSLVVGCNFGVASFTGKKGFLLSSATPLGGSRQKLSVAYLIVGCVSVAWAILVLLMRAFRARTLKPVVEYPVVKIVPKKEVEQRRMLPSLSIALPARKEHLETSRLIATPPDPAVKFASNFVSTSKYTVLNFVPMNLLLQFQRTANLYFLVIAILASLPNISPLGGSTFWFPLITVLGTTAVKDGLEDYRRHQSDVEENNRMSEVYNTSSGEFNKVPWLKITVGDIVRVTTGEDGCSAMLPCDLVLVCSSNVDGTVFLETANLDGETNLKLRESLEKVQKRVTSVEMINGNEQSEIKLDELRALKCKISCNPPDTMLYEFNAKIEIFGEELPLNGVSGGGQFLQRSTKLKNTKWCLGVCVYSGPETKIQMNMNEPPSKVSNLEKALNTYIFYLFGLLFTICTVGAVGSGVFAGSSDAAGAWYLHPQNATVSFNIQSPASTGVITWFTYLILLSLLIPISLYVSIEMVKTVIMLIISADREMYVEEEDLRSKARSSGLCEELGQVSYIFSDKTGTLTQNVMEFKKCSIAGIEFGQGYCEVERAIARKNGRVLPADPPPPAGFDKGFKFVDGRLSFGNWRKEEYSGAIESFLFNMSINHGVQVEYSTTHPEFPLFQAESPDEGAFVTAARNLGFFFSKRKMRDIHIVRADGARPGEILADGREEVWTVLVTNAFDNNRKRTSVVVQEGAHGEIILLVKGADTSVMPFIEDTCGFFEKSQGHIDKFGDQGLRTLVFAGRELTSEQWSSWYALYQQAAKLPNGREAALQQLASMLEEDHTSPGCVSALFDASTPYKRSLQLHGVTALEDKLQENVGDCIAQLAKAMIKIWVLTGDEESSHSLMQARSGVLALEC